MILNTCLCCYRSLKKIERALVRGYEQNHCKECFDDCNSFECCKHGPPELKEFWDRNGYAGWQNSKEWIQFRQRTRFKPEKGL